VTEFESVKHAFRVSALAYLFLGSALITHSLSVVPQILTGTFLIGFAFFLLRLQKTNPLHQIEPSERKRITGKYKWGNWTLIPFSLFILGFSGLGFKLTYAIPKAFIFGFGCTVLIGSIFILIYTYRMTHKYGSEVFD